MHPKKRGLILLILIIALILTTIVLADLGSLPIAWLRGIPDYDLWGHLLLYGLLAFSLNGVMTQTWEPIGGMEIPVSALITLAMILLEEISQLFFATRTFDLADIMAGALGMMLGSWFSLVKGHTRQGT